MITQLDPRILLHSVCDATSVSTDFEYLDRLISWLDSDREFVIGNAGRDLLLREFGAFGYPENTVKFGVDVDTSLIIGFINRLVQRSYRSEHVSTVPIRNPEYLSGEAVTESIANELTLASRDAGRAFATDRGHWSDEPRLIELVDGSMVSGITSGEERTAAECRATVEIFFSNLTVFVVGGKVVPPFLRELEQLGIDASRVRWVELQKGTSVKVIDQKLAGVRAGSHVVACLTGKLGHDGSGKAKAISVKRGARYVYGETLRELRDSLVSLAVSSPDPAHHPK
ncbi:hypothetical protein ACFQS2_03445 [Brachybacterium sp. GCM10030267]|uniref:hypothetical protein n=1 Tax=Brachybacterium sp. GCM10030267 TaxID=3273381 RepID=UPI0036151AEA